MILAYANMWTDFPERFTRAVTTNGNVRRDGTNIMGAGTAKQAADRFPDLPAILGALITSFGNQCFYLPGFNLVTFPTKDDVWNHSSLSLIARSCVQLVALANEHSLTTVVLPRPGCGVGGLKWDEVNPVVASLLDDRFIVVNYVEPT